MDMDREIATLPLYKKVITTSRLGPDTNYTLSSNGEYVVYWGKNYEDYYLHDVRSRTPVKEILENYGVVQNIVFSPTKYEILIIYTIKGKIGYELEDIFTKEITDLKDLNNKFGKDNGLTNLATYSNDGKSLIFIYENTIISWKIEKHKINKKIKINKEVYELVCSPNDKYVAISTLTDILIYDLNKKKKIYSTEIVGINLSFSADSKTLSLIDSKNSIIILNFIEKKQKIINFPNLSLKRKSPEDFLKERDELKIIGTANHVAVLNYGISFYNIDTLKLDYKLLASDYLSFDSFVTSNSKSNATLIMTKGESTGIFQIWDYSKLENSKAENLSKIKKLSAELKKIENKQEYNKTKAEVDKDYDRKLGLINQVEEIGMQLAGYDKEKWSSYKKELSSKYHEMQLELMNKKWELEQKYELEKRYAGNQTIYTNRIISKQKLRDQRPKEYKPTTFQCLNCHNQIPKSSTFCPDCGYKVERCPICKGPFTRQDDLIHCPYCQESFHKNHLLETIKIHGSCPHCSHELKDFDVLR